MHIIYLHGFCSSAQSFKAQVVKAFVDKNEDFSLCLENLSPVPAQAMQQVESYIAQLKTESWCLIGSSLGGFYAAYLGEKYDKKAVLINPAVRAHERLEEALGENHNYHSGDVFVFTQEHLRQLRDLFSDDIKKPENFFLLTQTGDEVLDFQQGVSRFRGSKQTVIEGGSHAFDDFELHLDDIAQFLKED